MGTAWRSQRLRAALDGPRRVSGHVGGVSERGAPSAPPRSCAAREHEVDLLLVTHPVNLRYLTGFTGTNGLA